MSGHPRLLGASQEFDPETRPTEDIELFTICRALADAPAITDSPSAVAEIQGLHRDHAFDEAIQTLRDLLKANELGVSGTHDVDHSRFAALRRYCKLTQKQLAERLGVTPGAVGRVESDQAGLSITRLLLASATFNVQPNQILKPLSPIDPER